MKSAHLVDATSHRNPDAALNAISGRTASQSLSSRIWQLDAAKFFAAIAVVAIHACQSPELGWVNRMARFAVPFFAAASMYAAVQSLARKKPGFFHFAIQKWNRLYVPFLVWSLAYFLFKWFKGRLLVDQESDLPGWEFLWLGSAYHLWFIPFLLGASLALFPILQRIQGLEARKLPAAIAFGMIGLGLAYLVPEDSGKGGFGVLVGQALPALLWGCSLGWCEQGRAERSSELLSLRGSFVPFATHGLMGLLFVVALFFNGFTGRQILLENGAGVLLLWICLQSTSLRTTLQSKLPPGTPVVRATNIAPMFESLGKIAMGIYFVHFLFLKVGESLVRKLHLSSSIALECTMFLFVAVASLLFAWTLARWKATRWLVC